MGEKDQGLEDSRLRITNPKTGDGAAHLNAWLASPETHTDMVRHITWNINSGNVRILPATECAGCVLICARTFRLGSCRNHL